MPVGSPSSLMRADVAPTQAQQLCRACRPCVALERLGGVKIRRRSCVRDEARSFHDVFDGFRFRGDR